MNVLSSGSLAAFWSAPEIAVNAVVFLNLLGALLLGLVVGYERAYHGRAAGMRTYGIVCMAAAALTVFAGYPGYWYGGHSTVVVAPDPTRLVQGIVTGVGFLGAGVIMKEGLNIRGLTTAASIWAASAIGVLVGVGFYAAAILLTALSFSLMMWGPRIEEHLPRRPTVAVVLRFSPGFEPERGAIFSLARERGYEILDGSLSITYKHAQAEWHFVAIAVDREQTAPLAKLAHELSRFQGIEQFQLSHARS